MHIEFRYPILNFFTAAVYRKLLSIGGADLHPDLDPRHYDCPSRLMAQLTDQQLNNFKNSMATFYILSPVFFVIVVFCICCSY